MFFFQLERTVLKRSEENRIVQWLTESARRGFGKTKAQVIDTVQSVIKEDKGRPTPFKDHRPGERWYQGFMSRHRDELSLRTPHALGSQRAGVTEDKIASWFKTAYEEISSSDPAIFDHPERIFNVDETGFQLVGAVSKVIARRETNLSISINIPMTPIDK